ncbi:hypothetical protein XBFFL1_1740001 [Xenorhabdus bovienii str. feltiae Florida]|nr:hypothetical protein XBFFL1_1740001 [Xenorhabdus bovienii str. feltiae Florida]
MGIKFTLCSFQFSFYFRIISYYRAHILPKILYILNRFKITGREQG